MSRERVGGGVYSCEITSLTPALLHFLCKLAFNYSNVFK